MENEYTISLEAWMENCNYNNCPLDQIIFLAVKLFPDAHRAIEQYRSGWMDAMNGGIAETSEEYYVLGVRHFEKYGVE
jgi:hypothetical protein